jgi:hypothetical protein
MLFSLGVHTMIDIQDQLYHTKLYLAEFTAHDSIIDILPALPRGTDMSGADRTATRLARA